MNRILFLFAFSLHATFSFAQVPNAGFENWTNLQPDDWTHNSCPFCDPPWESYIVRQDSDAYSGNFNADFYGNGIFKPYAYTQFPVAYRPIKLRFFAKIYFPPCINSRGFPGDTVAAKVQLFSNGAVVDSGYWSYSDTTISAYQLVEVPLTRTSAAFDSCRIYLEGGKIFGGCGINPEPTRFKVDEISLLNDSFTCSTIFYYSKKTDTVNFASSSNFNSASWLWDFGDGGFDSVMSPQHIYTQDGWYYVCVTSSGTDTSGFSCTATYCDSILITHDCIDTTLICPRPSLCCDAPLYEPVCGCDSVTYDNACQAALWYGVTRYTMGPCLTSLKESNPRVTVQLQPNPSRGKIAFSISPSETELAKIRITNVLGQTIAGWEAIMGGVLYTHEADLSDKPNGVYFAEVVLNRISVVKKFVKQ